MKPGDKVKCINTRGWKDSHLVNNIICPKFGDELTVRTAHVGMNSRIYLRFEEIVNPVITTRRGKSEPSFSSLCFRKLEHYSIAVENKISKPQYQS